MPAQWRLLTEYLLSADEQASLTWQELDTIVGGLPRSAVDHYPQWSHGDRPNTRAWRAAGYEATNIEPDIGVTFVRSGSERAASMAITRPRHSVSSASVTVTLAPAAVLDGLDPSRCLFIIPCSASKRKGGRTDAPVTAGASLAEARQTVLADPDSRADESLVMPAWQRYDGHLYRAAAPVLSELVTAKRLLILSGGYGLLEGRDVIGHYNRIMRTRDWPRDLLERLLADRAAESGLDIVAVASHTTDYVKVLRRTPWNLALGRTAHLVTLRGTRGASAVSRSLGMALRTFVEGRGEYPPGTVVERLDA
ncbi:hypothetical protein [Nocardioides sp.]|uniref:DUF7662 domain-containing protein n=1 Tax=Nocardioides sp. TaxID=35761 RepID=UPI00286D7021|nr:hypothetical protein [Nocardioides sp.]